MKWKVLLIVALLVGAGLAVGASLGAFGANASGSTSEYLTAQAAVTDVTAQVAATGTVAPSATWGLSFGTAPHAVTSASSSSDSASSGGQSVTWPVTNVAVAVGDTVHKGETLATAATTDLEARIADANRAWRTAKIQLSQAQDAVDAATTTDATRQADIGLYNAQTAVANARQTLLDLQHERAESKITAPADGVVTTVNIVEGADAPSSDAIQLAARPLEVTTSVVESDIASITLGQSATVTITALGTTVQGSVVAIAPTGSAGSNGGVVSFDVTISLTDAPAGLRPGMTADITITTASATGVLAIPARALQGTTGAYRVRVLNADGTVTAKDVTVGLITSSLVEIKSGLQAGDTVVTGTSSAQNSTNGTNGQGGGRFFGPGGGGGPTTVIKGGG